MPATGVAVGREEQLGFLDGGQLFRADGRIKRGSETDAGRRQSRYASMTG